MINFFQAQNYLMFTPRMTKMKLLQLHKLTELSGYLDAKLYLVQNFIPNAKVILTNQSLDYAKVLYHIKMQHKYLCAHY